ncbi:hypothetical protein PAXRUDRAFT_373049 [Paxillus rubicundulus Ve08.2h10]|uniref:Uncharacterized protein n=1 Tax=Paxillus rubicundulus Ve08.2h10 TaxID=930991 RepID=A0A0D0DZ20_9AGAM|nr:hypothetical protein PAXRUDRAFT_373049 [Paxillus rubicundulus Ve08.2h10]
MYLYHTQSPSTNLSTHRADSSGIAQGPAFFKSVSTNHNSALHGKIIVKLNVKGRCL